MEQEIKHSEDFIKSIAGTKTGYTTPTSYFSKAEETIYLRSMQNDFSKTEGYGVPESYFDTLEDRIFENLNKETKPKVIPIRKHLLRWIPAAAAVIALYFTLSTFDFSNNEVTNDDIVSWLESDLESITSEDFILAFEETELNNLSFASDDISTTTLEEYFDNEDITILLNELN